jgi:NAD(P)-dependent dehydrogenase (short-subunit alcohol dehydrogenase family)
MGRFDGKTAVTAGGTSGIGQVSAKRLPPGLAPGASSFVVLSAKFSRAEAAPADALLALEVAA